MYEKTGEMENDPSKANRSTIEPLPGSAVEEDDENQAELLLNVEEEVDDLNEYGDDDIFDESLPFGNEEFSALNRQLDQLQSALDEIELRNSDIHKELLEILHSNREVRKTMREEAEGGDDAVAAGSSDDNCSKDVPDAKTSSHSSSSVPSDEVDKMAELMINANSVGELIQSLKGQIDKN